MNQKYCINLSIYCMFYQFSYFVLYIITIIHIYTYIDLNTIEIRLTIIYMRAMPTINPHIVVTLVS